MDLAQGGVSQKPAWSEEMAEEGERTFQMLDRDDFRDNSQADPRRIAVLNPLMTRCTESEPYRCLLSYLINVYDRECEDGTPEESLPGLALGEECRSHAGCPRRRCRCPVEGSCRL